MITVALILLLVAAAAVSCAGTCTARSFNGTHVMVCPDPPGAKHELECHNKNLGRPSGAIVLNGELFQKDFPCELWGDCYVIPKNTCPNGHSIIHKTNRFRYPARCRDLPDVLSSTFPTLPPEPQTTCSLTNLPDVLSSTFPMLPPEPQTTRSLTLEVVAVEDTGRDFTRIPPITAGIFVVIVIVLIAVGIVLYKRRQKRTQVQ